MKTKTTTFGKSANGAEFINYLQTFYGRGGVYPLNEKGMTKTESLEVTNILTRLHTEGKREFVGDSFDREFARDLSLHLHHKLQLKTLEWGVAIQKSYYGKKLTAMFLRMCYYDNWRANHGQLTNEVKKTLNQRIDEILELQK